MRGGWVTVMAAVMVFACERNEPTPAPELPASPSPPPPTASSAAPVSKTAETAAVEPGTVTIGFVGDLNLSLHVGINLAKMKEGETLPAGVGPGYPFTHVVDRLRAADLMVGNLECVASVKGEVDTWHNPFRCPLAPETLLEAGFDVVSLANNHSKDFGRRGLLDMVANLDAAGLPHFGHENLINQKQSLWVREVEGIRVGLLGYYILPEPPLSQIEQARKEVDILITFMHWGTEGETQPMVLQRRLARDLIDADVDAVIGTHAHVPQPVEWYRGKIVAHGLGNFVFSGMTHTENHRTGDMIELDVGASGIEAARLVRIRLEMDGAPRFVDDPVRELEPPAGGTTPAMAAPPGASPAKSSTPK
jgi:poly-gamma-glutamate synthesis protein (capsule biosynthesis protein)